jgi:SAM-dependent methyltransferase
VTAIASQYPSFERANSLVRSSFRAFADILNRGRDSFGRAWMAEFEAVLEKVFPSDDQLATAFKGYVKFATDSVRLQAAFEKSGRYKGSSYAAASERVYQNDAYMMSEYLPGLLLSHYLWPHHYRQLQFFDSAFVRAMSDAGITRFVEVGVGTGVYSRRILEGIPGSLGLGYDVSPSSRNFALRHLAAFGVSGRYALELQDIVARPPHEQTKALVCVEVLEHLEQPVEFLRALRGMLAPGGRGFITAAVSADHADHIYLYRTAADVAEHVTAAGFSIEQSFAATAYPPKYPDQPVPVAAAFIVT